MQTFHELGLGSEILKALEDLGFQTPTPIQAKAVPTILREEGDLVALAQTGTGKTAAFSLPVIELTDLQTKKIQSLVLCPTRELCIQITKDVEKFTKYVPGFKVVAVYGGASITNQIKDIRQGCHMVVGTPGRMLDLIERGALNITQIKWLVLDEADEMLNMGFQEDLDSILSETPKEKQTLLFSATMPPAIARIAKKYMHEPETIEMGERNTGAKTVQHEYYMVQAKYRYEVLKRIADMNPEIYGIVFCRTRRETKEVADKLMADGYNADALYGDLSQAQRDHVMGRFRSRQLQMLVATDVAARGIDVNDITHVINYDLPDELEVYVHRSGRTGRAGKSGISISILHSRENRKLKDLERMVGQKFERKAVPDGRDICEVQLWKLIEKVEQVEVNEKEMANFLPAIIERFSSMEHDEILKRFISVEFNRFLAYYKNAKDLNAIQEPERGGEGRSRGDRGDRGDRPGRRAEGNFSRFALNIGSYNNINAARMMGIINEKVGHRNMPIGRIEVKGKVTFFEVGEKYESEILQAFKNAKVDGIPVAVEKAPGESRGGSRGGGGYERNDSGDRGGFRKRSENNAGSGGGRKSFKRRK